MSTQTRYTLLNLRDQPLELHLEDAVVVVPPRGRTEIPAAACRSPQVQALAKARHLSLRPVREAAAAPAPAAEAPAKRRRSGAGAPRKERPKKPKT